MVGLKSSPLILLFLTVKWIVYCKFSYLGTNPGSSGRLVDRIDPET